MKLGDISPPAGAVKRKKRLGCGPGSGHGKTSGRGHKGQKARSGAKVKPWFEGGQMPLQRRLPKAGFTSQNRVTYQVVNLGAIARRGLFGEVTPETLRAAGLIRSLKQPVKVLGQGEISEALRVRVHAVSASASEKVVRAGGSVEILSERASAADTG